jgi:hypothetical protein
MRGRGSVLAISSDDPILRWVGAIGLASSARTALIVDLVGPLTGRTLADLVGDGPKLAELSPGRNGVATISAGHVEESDVARAVELLARSWPAVVVRSDGVRWGRSTVSYRGMYPGALSVTDIRPSVWQPAGGAVPTRLPGVVLPRLGSRHFKAMLSGRMPIKRSWVAAWGRVWSQPWA